MMVGRVMFTDVISRISSPWSPVYLKHVLIHAVTDPIEPHVNSFCGFLFQAGVCEADCRRIVDLDGSGGLWMPHLFQADAERDRIFGG